MVVVVMLGHKILHDVHCMDWWASQSVLISRWQNIRGCAGFFFKVVPSSLPRVAELMSNASSVSSKIPSISSESNNYSSSSLKVSLKFTLRSSWSKLLPFYFMVLVGLEPSINANFPLSDNLSHVKWSSVDSELHTSWWINGRLLYCQDIIKI